MRDYSKNHLKTAQNRSKYFGDKNPITFAPIEPAKPLYNAQIGRSFYIISMAKPFNKTFFTPRQLIELLKSRGLHINNEEKAEEYLATIGYFRLSAYFFPLLQFPKTNHKYKSGDTFQNAMDMWICMIRYLLFSISPRNTFKERLMDLFKAYPTIDKKAMVFSQDWEQDDFWK